MRQSETAVYAVTEQRHSALHNARYISDTGGQVYKADLPVYLIILCIDGCAQLMSDE